MSSPKFRELLRQVCLQHEDEIAALRAQLAHLHGAAALPPPCATSGNLADGAAGGLLTPRGVVIASALPAGEAAFLPPGRPDEQAPPTQHPWLAEAEAQEYELEYIRQRMTTSMRTTLLSMTTSSCSSQASLTSAGAAVLHPVAIEEESIPWGQPHQEQKEAEAGSLLALDPEAARLQNSAALFTSLVSKEKTPPPSEYQDPEAARLQNSAAPSTSLVPKEKTPPPSEYKEQTVRWTTIDDNVEDEEDEEDEEVEEPGQAPSVKRKKGRHPTNPTNPSQSKGSVDEGSERLSQRQGTCDMNPTETEFAMFSLRPEWCNDCVTRSHITNQKEFIRRRGQASILLKRGQSTKWRSNSMSFRCSALQRFPLHPRSRFRLCWEVGSVLLLFMDMVWLPMQVFNLPDNIYSLVLSLAPMTFWTVDVGMSFVTSFYSGNGKLEERFGPIARRYMRTWFLPDLVLVSNDWVALILEAIVRVGAGELSIMRISKMARLGRNLRTLRLLRVAKLHEVMIFVRGNMHNESSTLVFEMGLTALTLVILNHCVACLWFYIGSRKRDDTWVHAEGIRGEDIATRYAYSLHWSLTQFTPASMEVFPQNTGERCFAVVIILFAMLSFSSFVSSITSGMTRLRMLQSDRAKKDFMMRKFLREHAIAHDLSMRITRHVFMAMKSRGRSVPMQQVELFSYLTAPLQLELQKELFKPWLSKHPFFEEYLEQDPEAVRELCSHAIKQQNFALDDLIFKRGNVATQMYFVVSGLLSYRLQGTRSTPAGVKSESIEGPQDTGESEARKMQAGEGSIAVRSESEVVPLQKGGWLSEAVIWLPWVHMGSARAVMDSEVATISAKGFSQVTVKFPDTYEWARIRAQQFLEMLAKPENAHDIPDQHFSPSEDEEPAEFQVCKEMVQNRFTTAPTTKDGSDG